MIVCFFFFLEVCYFRDMVYILWNLMRLWEVCHHIYNHWRYIGCSFYRVFFVDAFF